MRTALLLLVLAGGALNADNINLGGTYTGVTTISPGVYRWTYQVAVSDLNKFDGSSVFTLYDVLGFTDATLLAALTTPAGWTASVQDVGTTPFGVMLFDNPSQPNVTWRRTDTTPLLGNTVVSGFAITTTLAWRQTVQWSMLANTVAAPTALKDILNQGTTFAPAAIPEPGTAALALIPLIYLAYLRRPVRPAASSTR